ncbi:MAG TPA: glycosyltransferase, partial [Methanomicrobiales archaeon]|nr:glycosyltransferase [Methanomicrobiales archaeon]
MAFLEGNTCICDNGRTLEDHRPIVGDAVMEEIYEKAAPLQGKRLVHVNSTYQSGGVAEMILSLVPLLNDAGIETEWKILSGNSDFFTITKSFHNGLQGEAIPLSEAEKSLYLHTNEEFSRLIDLDCDCVVIHDPQPLPLIAFCEKKQPWVWRCHIDLSAPQVYLWEFLRDFVLKYDRMVVSHDQYRRGNMPIPQKIVYPAIDPLSDKNRDLSAEEVERILREFNVPTDKPLITQISRFDKWKDPEGVIDVFRIVRERVDCRLVLCGSMAPDDPEGWMIYRGVEEKARDLLESGDLILLTVENNLLVNALQRASAVILQKSLREGFGLTVTEALWKGKPVISSRVGGIRLQIQDGESGYLLDPTDTEGFANRILQVLEDPDLADRLGRNGKEYVRKNFLITRKLLDYLDMMNEELSISKE